jgi:hypothetical protein
MILFLSKSYFFNTSACPAGVAGAFACGFAAGFGCGFAAGLTGGFDAGGVSAKLRGATIRLAQKKAALRMLLREFIGL